MRIPGSDSPVVLLDTDVLSFAFGQDPVRVPRYEPHLQGKILCMSFVSTAELRFGARRRGWGERRAAELEEFINLYRIVESDPEISRFWAYVRSEGMRTGFNIDKQDAWIAAVALHLRVPLVTHNAEDFEHVADLEVISEPDVSEIGHGSGRRVPILIRDHLRPPERSPVSCRKGRFSKSWTPSSI